MPNFYLLTAADNGQGGSVEFSYEDTSYSVEYCIESNYRFRVSTKTLNDGIGDVITTTYTYTNPWGTQLGACPFNEFGGHEQVLSEIEDGSGTSSQVIENYYHQRDGNYLDARKGLIWKSITYEPESGELARTETEWTESLVNGMPWVRQTAVTSTVGSVSQLTTYDYATDHQNGSQYGNVTHVREYDGTSGAPYRSQEMWYYPRNVAGSTYIVNLPARQQTWDGEVSTGTCVGHSQYRYDSNNDWNQWPTVGELKMVRVAIDNCTGGWSETEFAYDSWGNVTSQTDPLDHTTTTTYDTSSASWPKLYVYPLTVTLPQVGATTFTTTYTWDKVLGQTTEVVDPNGSRTSYEYDQWGRLTGVWEPGESKSSGHSATKIIAYTNYVNSSSPYRIQSRQRDDVYGGSGYAIYLNSYTFYSGMGQVMQTQAESTSVDRSILVDTHYNPLGLVITQTLPYNYNQAPGSYRTPDPTKPNASYTYDGLGRVTQVTNPDDTVVRTYYSDLKTAVIDELDHMTISETDRFGRLSSVRQYEGTVPGTPNWASLPTIEASATYQYDVGDRLTQLTDPISASTHVTYNVSGWKTAMTDPIWERGTIATICPGIWSSSETRGIPSPACTTMHRAGSSGRPTTRTRPPSMGSVVRPPPPTPCNTPTTAHRAATRASAGAPA